MLHNWWLGIGTCKRRTSSYSLNLTVTHNFFYKIWTLKCNQSHLKTSKNEVSLEEQRDRASIKYIEMASNWTFFNLSILYAFHKLMLFTINVGPFKWRVDVVFDCSISALSDRKIMLDLCKDILVSLMSGALKALMKMLLSRFQQPAERIHPDACCGCRSRWSMRSRGGANGRAQARHASRPALDSR